MIVWNQMSDEYDALCQARVRELLHEPAVCDVTFDDACDGDDDWLVEQLATVKLRRQTTTSRTRGRREKARQ